MHADKNGFLGHILTSRQPGSRCPPSSCGLIAILGLLGSGCGSHADDVHQNLYSHGAGIETTAFHATSAWGIEIIK